jgi:hypothetical protein
MELQAMHQAQTPGAAHAPPNTARLHRPIATRTRIGQKMKISNGGEGIWRNPKRANGNWCGAQPLGRRNWSGLDLLHIPPEID